MGKMAETANKSFTWVWLLDFRVCWAFKADVTPVANEEKKYSIYHEQGSTTDHIQEISAKTKSHLLGIA